MSSFKFFVRSSDLVSEANEIQSGIRDWEQAIPIIESQGYTLFLFQPEAGDFIFLFKSSYNQSNQYSYPFTTTPITLLQSNISRGSFTIYNNTNGTLYVLFGNGVTSSNFTLNLAANAFYQAPVDSYTGVVTGIGSGSSGNILVTEIYH